MKMVNKLVVCLVIMLALILQSCANSSRNVYEKNVTQRTLFKAKYGAKAVDSVMQVVEKVVAPFEEQYQVSIEDQIKLIQAKADASNFMMTKDSILAPSSEAQYAMSWMGALLLRSIDNSTQETIAMIKAHGDAELARARAQAIEYLTPIIEKIYATMQEENGGAPPSIEQIGIEFVKQIPFVATIGGMYALGAKGIEAATAKISGTFTNSSVATGKGAQSAAGASRTGGSSGDNLTEIAGEEATEEAATEAVIE